MEFYPISDKEARIKVYKNGVHVGTSTNYYNSNRGATVQTTYNKIMINSMTSPAVKLYIDNLVTYHYTELEYKE